MFPDFENEFKCHKITISLVVAYTMFRNLMFAFFWPHSHLDSRWNISNINLIIFIQLLPNIWPPPDILWSIQYSETVDIPSNSVWFLFRFHFQVLFYCSQSNSSFISHYSCFSPFFTNVTISISTVWVSQTEKSFLDSDFFSILLDI